MGGEERRDGSADKSPNEERKFHSFHFASTVLGSFNNYSATRSRRHPRDEESASLGSALCRGCIDELGDPHPFAEWLASPLEQGLELL